MVSYSVRITKLLDCVAYLVAFKYNRFRFAFTTSDDCGSYRVGERVKKPPHSSTNILNYVNEYPKAH